jgi:two-component system chemotaxis response regulator CheB
VREPADKEPIEPGAVYLAPADYHLLVEPDGFALSTDGPVQHSRPSIDVLFDTAADTYGDRLIGVILTGANADGAYGLSRIKRRGGTTIVQDPETAEKRAMPDAAIATGAADRVVPLEQIPPTLMELIAA